jgi:prepilin-type N-terminal cleavage/methylation domain-containing protein
MRRRGYTLIETLACVAIAAVLARTGTLAAVSLATSLRVATTARTLAQTMRALRARAMAEGRPLEVRFDATASRWSVRTDDGTIRRDEPLPATVRFTSLPARALVRFGATGTADNGTVALGAGASSARIVVNQRGRVRLG